jgi:RNA polymerase primary sigma factor
MASEMKVTPESEEVGEKEGPESPPLELSDAVVMCLLQSAEKRGYVTNDQIDALFSSPEAKSEQIEDVLAKFSEMGVHVVETDRELEVKRREQLGKKACMHEHNPISSPA